MQGASYVGGPTNMTVADSGGKPVDVAGAGHGDSPAESHRELSVVELVNNSKISFFGAWLQ